MISFLRARNYIFEYVKPLCYPAAAWLVFRDCNWLIYTGGGLAYSALSPLLEEPLLKGMESAGLGKNNAIATLISKTIAIAIVLIGAYFSEIHTTLLHSLLTTATVLLAGSGLYMGLPKMVHQIFLGEFSLSPIPLTHRDTLATLAQKILPLIAAAWFVDQRPLTTALLSSCVLLHLSARYTLEEGLRDRVLSPSLEVVGTVAGHSVAVTFLIALKYFLSLHLPLLSYLITNIAGYYLISGYRGIAENHPKLKRFVHKLDQESFALYRSIRHLLRI